MKLYSFISTITALLCLSTTSAFGVQVDPVLEKALDESPAKTFRVLVHLEGELDLNHRSPQWGGKESTKTVAALENFHQNAFQNVLSSLDATWSSSEFTSINHLWIINSFQMTAGKQTLLKLMQNPAVESIVIEQPKEIEPLGPGKATLVSSRSWGQQVSWAAEIVGAPALWNIGIFGQFALVAMIDTGANILHPDLKGALWFNTGEYGTDQEKKDKVSNGKDDDGNGYIDDIFGYNFQDNNADLSDSNGHGTQTAGIVGGRGYAGISTGLAPMARLMILKSCCSGDNAVFESATWTAIQYAVKMRARIISMSLTLKPNSNPSYAKWRRLSEAVFATGVSHINSAGNLGSNAVPNNMGAPATNPPAWFHPRQVAGRPSGIIVIGATDQSDKPRYYSSTGPVTWENIEPYKDYPFAAGTQPGLIRPDVCGPSEMPSLSNDGKTYTSSFGGTSSATPAVAGVAALLVSARPSLNIVQITEALQMTAKPVSEAGFDNLCGAGRVDAVNAYHYVLSHF